MTRRLASSLANSRTPISRIERCLTLVLSRHRDESIIIGDDIVITVVDIRGDKVRLGIMAPIEISVHRQEVYEAIMRENRAAAQNTDLLRALDRQRQARGDGREGRPAS